uniref:Transmembrane protein n=1 Tax=Macrostomum lignano TaxID=282301 RepID=A0A1I8HKS5_9PLAT
MHNLILMLDAKSAGNYGDVMCVAHPLTELDTIRQDGSINKDSSLIYIAFGFFRMFFSFAAYFVFFLTVFLLRPGTDRYPKSMATNTTLANGTVVTTVTTVKSKCYLLATPDWESYLRLVCECIVVVMATTNLCFVTRDIYYQGFRIYLMMLKATPMRCLYQTSCILVVAMVPCRAACESQVEDYIAVFAILFTAPYFLFFCRGFKIVGPFVLMIYRMVVGDLLRFCTIYIIFMMGFSQAMFIVFRRVDASIFHDPGEALMGMFIMSLGEFAEIYEQFDCSSHSSMGK